MRNTSSETGTAAPSPIWKYATATSRPLNAAPTPWKDTTILLAPSPAFNLSTTLLLKSPGFGSYLSFSATERISFGGAGLGSWAENINVELTLEMSLVSLAAIPVNVVYTTLTKLSASPLASWY